MNTHSHLILRILIGNKLFIFIYLIAHLALTILYRKNALFNHINLAMALSIGMLLVSYLYSRYVGLKIAETAVHYILNTFPTEMIWIDSQRDQKVISDVMADGDRESMIEYSQQLSSLDSLCVILNWNYIGIAISTSILISLSFFYSIGSELIYYIQIEALLLGAIGYWIDCNKNTILTDVNSHIKDLHRIYEIMHQTSFTNDTALSSSDRYS